MLNTASKLLLTAVVSLAAGAGGTYVTVHIAATCDVAEVAPGPPSRFMDARPLPTSGWPKY